MLKDAPILLLDEATSALYSESERHVQQALGQLISGRTTFVIAHRPSTVIDAHLIYVMDDGRLVEQGSHAELLARGCHYEIGREAGRGKVCQDGEIPEVAV